VKTQYLGVHIFRN